MNSMLGQDTCEEQQPSHRAIIGNEESKCPSSCMSICVKPTPSVNSPYHALDNTVLEAEGDESKHLSH